MATIAARKRKDGSTGYTAQVLLKQKGKIVFREAKTFDSKREAVAWAGYTETKMRKPGALESASVQHVTLAEAIDKYLAIHRRIGRTKEQVLRSIKTYEIASSRCNTIRSPQIVTFAEELSAGGRKPQTVQNYMSHLQAVFKEAKPGFDIPLDYEEIRAAMIVLKGRGTTAKSAKRERRPTLPEIGKLMEHFADRQVRAPQSVPMCKVIAFALYSTRRQEEITRIEWRDFDEAGKRVMVRDLKHPGQKIGNNVWCDLPDEAVRV
ncbi:integrase, partial [Salmonella enterica subsp. enterica serovar Java]|nr:integrase [Salmonella enterica subsp. enterica serovar Java]